MEVEEEKTDAMKAALARLVETLSPVSDEKERAWTWKNHISPTVRHAGFERRFTDSYPLSLTKAQKSVLTRVESLCRGRGAIVALVGPRGTGKTSIVANIAIGRAWARDDYFAKRPGAPAIPPAAVRYTKLQSIISELKPLYGDMGTIDADRLQERKESITQCGLLVLDEKHECNDIKMTDRLLTDIVDIRYASRLDTVIISNESVDGFNRSTSSSILSRLDEHGCIIACEWKSFRTPANTP